MFYDAILIHPPSIYDFREKPVFPGPIAYSVGESTDQFIIPPIGMLSIADYLDRNGYKVVVDNLGERMLASDSFDAEEHIKGISATVYAIGLHWCVHSQGAIEVAKLCKKLHPDALVILGGLTATVFAEEIIYKYEFVDAVLRGEAEKPFLALIRAMGKERKIKEVLNLTFRDSKGKIRSNPLMEPSDNLDEFEFTRLDLLEPRGAVFTPRMPPHWGVPVCRGCLYNCVTCGGSAYSYKIHLGRGKPAFRSPERIVEDIRKLNRQGIKIVFLFQDPRMGGAKYWRSLITALRQARVPLTLLTMELFRSGDEEYIKELSQIGMPVSLSISPESLVESVRKAHGRDYTNEGLLRTIEFCKKYGVILGIHSMIALSQDTEGTIKETWKGWEETCSLNQDIEGKKPVSYAFGPMILLDPGSLAFNSPADYGYRLIFKTLQDYIEGMSLPSWHQWISYETKFLNRDSIIELIIDSIEYSINIRVKYGLYSKSEADALRLNFVNASRLGIDVINEVMRLPTEDEKLEKLRSFREYLNRNIPKLRYI